MSKEEKNFFGKRKPSGFLMDNFYMKKEEATGKLKFEHKSGDFSFRIWAGIYLDGYYNSLKENADNAAVILSGIKTFVIMCLQEPKFFLDFTVWFKEYMKEKAEPATEDEHEADLEKVKRDMEIAKEMINYESEPSGDVVNDTTEAEQGGVGEDSGGN